MANITRFSLEVQPTIPQNIARLEELANDLLYSWDRGVRRLFYRLDNDLWHQCGHNPKTFLRRVAQQRLDEASQDRVFMEDYHRVLSVFDSYFNTPRSEPDVKANIAPNRDLVAYFCAEFGFHESLPIYSGGLGILAGDHCKAASDLGMPFVAIGLLYRQGYFSQTIDSHGNQIAHNVPTNFEDLPVTPALDPKNNKELHISVNIAGRDVQAKVWKARAGLISLYLLDTDLPQNSEEDRQITYQLYGGDTSTRIQQEIVLGVGGVKALRALDLAPTAWHINEGHAAFQIIERCREYIEQGCNFDTALELVASATIFTTHTPVPAGHDVFSEDLINSHLGQYIKSLKINKAEFLDLGASPISQGGFNQTALALRGSRFHNGVSRIHGGVASKMEAYIWPQVPHTENPIGYVTNGVHIYTFLSSEWVNLFDMRFGGDWRNQVTDFEFWNVIDEIPDHSYWNVRRLLKAELFEAVKARYEKQSRRNGESESTIHHVMSILEDKHGDILTFGFARRFATYKRANLLLKDPNRLARIVNDADRPVLFLFAGKAHPNDLPGQALIRQIHQMAREPRFQGKLLIIENYDLALGRRLVTGVDVWLNTPEFPMEASGTSGEKAGLNGVINCSVPDGWWGEGYNGSNGWSITPHGDEFDHEYRDNMEANELLDLIEHEIVPLYYRRGGHGYSNTWVAKSKESMKTTLPRFNAQRMVLDYATQFYGPAIKHTSKLLDDGYKSAKQLAKWKRMVIAAWSKVRIRRLDIPTARINAGDKVTIRVAVKLDGLKANDVIVECVIGIEDEQKAFQPHAHHILSAEASQPGAETDDIAAGETVFSIELKPDLPGLQFYKLRIYPYHPLFAHQFEIGCMHWV